MANSRSARKRIRSNERKRVRNRAVRAAVRTTVGKARRAVLAQGAEAEAEVKMAVRALDRAAEKGILHPNNARRRKSRLAGMAARLVRAAGGEAGEQAAARTAAAGGAKGRSARPPAARKASAKPVGKPAAKPAARGTSAAASKPARSGRPARSKPGGAADA